MVLMFDLVWMQLEFFLTPIFLIPIALFFVPWAIVKYVLHKKYQKLVGLLVVLIVGISVLGMLSLNTGGFNERIKQENILTQTEVDQFQELVKQAKETNDISICNSFPEPTQFAYRFDDFDLHTPSQEKWIVYCEALVNDDILLCEKIGSPHTNPSLLKMCKSQLEK